MRGHFFLKIAALTAGMGMLVGCGGSVDPEPSTTAHHKTTPSTTYDTPSDDTGANPTHSDPSPVSEEETFRDYAAFVFRNAKGQQVLVQWILSQDGTDYWTRSCPIPDKGGVLFKECRDWSWYGKPIIELGKGLEEFGHTAGGMGAYTYSGVDANGDPQQYVAQTMFTDRGDMRVGRVCTIDPKSLDEGSPFSSCSNWKTLEIQSVDLHVNNVQNFHDDNLLTFKTSTGDDVFMETVLSIDGSQTWTRSCATTGGAPWQGPGCDFAPAESMAKQGMQVNAISGHGSFVYMDGDKQMLMQTVITVTGAQAQQRICPVGDNGPIYEECGQWNVSSLTKLHMTEGPL